jgi:hypothetical protein
VQQIEAILAKLKEAMGAGAAPAGAAPASGAPAAPGGGGEHPGGPPSEGSSEKSDPPSNEKDTDMDPTTENQSTEEKPEGDAVEGLNEDPNSQKINVDSETTEQGTASPGPAAGKHTGQGSDAALRAMYADTAVKAKLYDRLSKVVGAFDGAMDVASATAADIAAYGVKKLKLKVAKGQERVALDAYLTGVETARREVSTKTVARATADAAQSEVPAIAAYFKE